MMYILPYFLRYPPMLLVPKHIVVEVDDSDHPHPVKMVASHI